MQANVTHQGEAGVIEVLGTLAMRGVLIEVEPDFRARTGLSFTAGYKSTNAQLIAISAGAIGDVAVMTRQGIDQLVGEGKIVAGSTATSPGPVSGSRCPPARRSRTSRRPRRSSAPCSRRSRSRSLPHRGERHSLPR